MIKEFNEKIEYPIYRTKKVLYCDKCGEAMIRMPFVYMTDPPLYSYRCLKCNKEETNHEILDNKFWDKTMEKDLANL